MVWGRLRQSLDPSINALATIILAFTIGATLVGLRVLRYRGCCHDGGGADDERC